MASAPAAARSVSTRATASTVAVGPTRTDEPARPSRSVDAVDDAGPVDAASPAAPVTMDDEDRRAMRAEVLRAHGATEAEAVELLAYGEGDACVPANLPVRWPLADEPFAAAWDGYAEAAGRDGAWPVLRDVLVQLRFPVEAGVAESDAYRRATRRGDVDGLAAGGGVRMEAPERLRLWVHPTPAGRIPVVLAGARADFETLVRAITARNQPVPVPASMGACIVAGYNNWERVARFRREWEASGDTSCGWSEAFAALVPRRELYQDRFILLSPGPYSGVAADDVGRPADAWARESVALRLEHECAHYLTRRVLGSMRNTLRDEVVADFASIRAAAGRFRADWLLRFLGLERFPAYRAGGRMENYRGGLSSGAFTVLQRVVHAAAAELAAFDATLPTDVGDALRAEMLLTLCAHSLEEIAAGALRHVRVVGTSA